MPTLKEEILILLKEGFLIHLSDPCRKFKMGTPYKPGSYYNAIRRLTEEGHIEKYRTEKKKKIHIRLTRQGKNYIKKHQASIQQFPRNWDKKWRIVVFDIPEKKRDSRNSLRGFLKMLGFGKVQRSIWISPHDFTEVIRQYIEKLKLSEYVFQIIAAEFQGFSESILALKFWDIKGIHRKYLDFIERYVEKQKILTARLKKNPREKDVSSRILKEHIIWDYQSIHARDPHLPAELLPDDWGGEKARKFVDNFIKRVF